MDLGPISRLHFPQRKQTTCPAEFDPKKNIRLIYAFEFVTGLFFFLPVLVLFFLERGLSFTQILGLQAAFSAALIIFEIPSGYLTDRIGRKRSLILACSAFIAASCIYSLGTGFIHFLIAEMAYAVFFALLSGTDSALCYDSLLCGLKQKTFKSIWGKAMSFNLIGLAVACIVGGALGQIDLALPLYLMVGVSVIALFIALLMDEPKMEGIKKPISLSAVINFIKGEARIHEVISYSSLAEGLMHSSIWFIQPYLTDMGMAPSHIGLFFTLVYLSSAFGSALAGKIPQGSVGAILMIIPFLVGVSFITLALNPHSLAAFSFFVVFFFRGVTKVLLEQMANDTTPSNIRATVLSVKGMGERLIYGAAILALGLIWDARGIHASLMALSSFVFLFALFYLILSKRH